MIKLKTNEEIEVMKEGGNILKNVVKSLLPFVKPGRTTLEIDKEAERLILENGAYPSFKKVPKYHWTTCLPVNEEIVHAIPGKRVLKNGDVLTIDIGVFYKGFHTDYATTFIVGDKKDKKIEHFLQVGKESLDKAIKQVKTGNRIGHISKTIFDQVTKNGYFTIEELTGHGIGKNLHEDPFIFGFLKKPIEKTEKIVNGTVIAIEVIYSFSSKHISYIDENDWTLVTEDGSISACFEHTVAFYKNRAFILT